MTKTRTILMIVAAMFLGGCSHSQWANNIAATIIRIEFILVIFVLLHDGL